MAQACVMMRPRQEHLLTPGKPPLSPQLDSSLITSTVRKRKGDPADSPLPLPPEEGKRQRTPPVDRGLMHGGGDAVMHVVVAPVKLPQLLGAVAMEADSAPEPNEGQQQLAGPCQHQRTHQQQHQQHHEAAGGASGDAELFSPLFHLYRESSSGNLSASSVSEAVALDVAAATPPRSSVSDPQPLEAQQQRQQQEAEENTSTDQSTGTSAGLVDADGGADVASPALVACSLAVANPPPAPHPPAAAAAAAAAEEGDDEYLEFDPLLFIKRLPPLERCVAPRRDFLLPKKTRRSKQKTLVLDLDETLVHSTLDGYCRPDFTFPVEVGTMRHMVSVRQRPHLHTFLERVAQLFEVVVFTASQRVYAEQLLNIVDPERRLVRHRVFRESCVFWEGNYLKDLTVLGRDLEHTIIVDNSPQAFGFQLDNGIPIESWYDDDCDEELLKLIPFLEKVAHAEDVRPHIQNRYRLRSLVEAANDPEQYLFQQQQQQ